MAALVPTPQAEPQVKPLDINPAESKPPDVTPAPVLPPGPAPEKPKPPMAHATSAPVSAPQGPSHTFVTPEWAASSALQSSPLPEARDLVTLVLAVQQANKLGPANKSHVLRRLRDIDPGIFKRYKVGEKLEELVPWAQRYVAVHIELPQMDGLGPHGEEVLVLQDPLLPFYASFVLPPSYEKQMEALFQRAGVPVEAWQAPSEPAEPAEVAAAPAEVQLRPRAYGFPAPRTDLDSGVRQQLRQPSFFFALVDVLRDNMDVTWGVPPQVALRLLRGHLGTERVDEICAACKTWYRYLGAASQVIKLRYRDPVAQQGLLLEDLDKPFWQEQANVEYSAYAHARFAYCANAQAAAGNVHMGAVAGVQL